MEENIARVLVETTVQKALREMKDFPERGIRNLIDMGVEFSGGRFQRYFFGIAQSMLQNEESAYYQLIRDVIQYVDLDKIKRFGVNLGYNSCTVGAKEIRTVEALENFDVPWSLGFFMNGQFISSQEKRYHTVIEQGMKLGIYTYFLYVNGNPLAALPFLEAHSQCAFVIFCRPVDVRAQLLSEMQSIQNVMIAVEYGDGIEQACRMLKRNGFLYAVYFLYLNKDFWNVLNGTILSRIQEITPPVTALIPHPSCPVRIQESVYRYVLDVRKKQHDPTILLDAKYDNMYVDGVISEDSCLAWFDAAGQLHSYDKKYESAEYNMFQNELRHIFKLAFPKDSEEKGKGQRANENRNY